MLLCYNYMHFRPGSILHTYRTAVPWNAHLFNKFVPRYMTLYMFLHVIPTTKSSQSHASWIWGMNSEFSPLTNPLPMFTTNQGINISIYYSIFPLESLWILWTASCLVNLVSRNFSEIMMHETKGFSWWYQCFERHSVYKHSFWEQ